jgi:hypothetical protein
MVRESVSSTNLKSVGYDSETETLEIEFSRGDVYEYYDVPEHIFISLMNASSHVKYFYKNIKNDYKSRQK